MKISIVKFSSKDLSEVKIVNETDPLFIKYIAFAGINISEDNLIANLCFECIDSERFLINLNIGIMVNNDEEFIENYSDLPLTGLLHTKSGVSNLTILDLFRKVKRLGKEYYSAICWDVLSAKANEDGHVSFKEGNYYKVYFTRDQFYYIQAYLRDVQSGSYVDYDSNDILLTLTPDSTNISIDDPKDVQFEILGVDYPKKSSLIFKKDYYELDILMKVNDKFCLLWNLSYNPIEAKEILKNKKYKPIDIDSVKDYEVYKSIRYIVVDYAVSADNPIQKVIIYSNNIGSSVDVFDVFTTISIHKQLYINWVKKIYEELTK